MKKSLGAKTFLGPCPVLCIGSYDVDGRPNVMTAAWGGICCSKPPAVTVSLRKATHTYSNIMQTQAYTVSVAPASYAKEVDYLGIASGRTADKFEAAGLTPVKADKVNAPYVEEFPLVLECRLIHTLEIGLHTQLVGEIVEVKADEAILEENGLPAMLKLDPFLYDAAQGIYFGTGGLIGRAFDIGKSLR